jgi:hypothetical protein
MYDQLRICLEGEAAEHMQSRGGLWKPCTIKKRRHFSEPAGTGWVLLHYKHRHKQCGNRR